MSRTQPTKQEFDALKAVVEAADNASHAYYSSSSAKTTTTHTEIVTAKHTSNTGRVVVLASGVIKTSIQTSRLYVTRDGTELGQSITNLQSAMTAVLMCISTVEKGVEKTYSLNLASQTTSATATLFGYNSANLLVFDVGTPAT